MEIQIAVAKINQFNASESGDTIEIIERPNGGLSVVMCDGHFSGREAKLLSGSVVHKVISLISDGVRDGAAARAASDFLYFERNGQFPAYLNILSVDLQTNTIVITRNNPMPIFTAQGDRVECISGSPHPIGISRNIRPMITEISIQPNTTVIMYTDGVGKAGTINGGLGIDICTSIEAMLEDQEPTAQYLADGILVQAVRLDENRPADDMSIVVLRIDGYENDSIRRMSVRLPVNYQ